MARVVYLEPSFPETLSKYKNAC